MKGWRVFPVFILLLLVGDIWGFVVVFVLPAPVPAIAQQPSGSPESEGIPATELTTTSQPTLVPTPAATLMLQPTATPTPTLQVPTTAPTSATSIVPAGQSLPALYIDGPYLKRSDTHQPVWLKGVNVEEFRQGARHTLADLYADQGLKIVTAQKWGINLLRIAVDPELVQSTSVEIDKAVSFAQAKGMYVILAPFASSVDPSRSEEQMAVPDDQVAAAMGFLADRFRNRSNVLYEIWNEPHPDTLPSTNYDQQWQIWMQAGIKVAQSIRSRNPQAILVVPGGTKWARDLTYYQEHPFPFGSVIYDVHDYAAAPDYHYSRDMWTWAIGKYPLIIGEFGGSPISALDPISIPYMTETMQIVNQNPGLVHYAMYVLSDDGAWGIFTPRLQRMPRGNLLLDDLRLYAPTRFR